MESERTTVRAISESKRDQVLRTWLRRIGDFPPRDDNEPCGTPPWRWVIKSWAINHGKSLQGIYELNLAINGTILNGLTESARVFSEQMNNLGGTTSFHVKPPTFSELMHEKQNRQYGPPQRRRNMRHRHHR